MDFFGPEAADFTNVARLNLAFLTRLRDASRGQALRERLPAGVAGLAAGLSSLQIERLAETPFLLLSLRERDEEFWRAMTAVEVNLELFGGSGGQPHADQLGAAALSFLWQLARRNAYAARLVSGATLRWCDRLADCTLLDLLQRTAGRDDWIRPRLAGDESVWKKLLGAGLDSDAAVRRAAHMTALQIVLTRDPVDGYRPLRAAACRVAIPALSVADPGQRR